MATAAFVYWLPVTLIWGLLIAFAVGSLCAAFFYGKVSRRLKRLAWVLWGLTMGTAFFAIYWETSLNPMLERIGTTQEITGEVTAEASETRFGSSVVVRLLENGKRTGKVLLYTDALASSFHPGDRLSLTVEFRSAMEPDSSFYYLSQGISLIGTQRGEWQLTPCEKIPLRYWPASLASKVKEKIEMIFSPDTAGFMQALLTGDRSELDYQVRNEMSITGVYHTVAISGMHVGILVSLLLWVTCRKKQIAALVGFPVIVFFMVFVGGAPSVIRAGIMAMLLLLAPLVRREEDVPTSLALALLLLLGNNPYALSSWGLQLSFASVIGIHLFSQRLFQSTFQWEWIQKIYEGKRWKKKVVNFLLSGMSVYLGANALTLPLSILYFGMVSLVGLLGNLLILWAITVLFTCGAFACGIAMFSPFLGRILGWGIDYLVRYVLWVCRGVSQIPNGAVYVDGPYMALFLLFYLMIFYCVMAGWNGRILFLGTCCSVSIFCLCFYLAAREYQTAQFTFSAVDVGQGECLYFETSGFSCIFDCGGSDADLSGEAAARYLQTIGRNHLDCLILSHYDTDHMGGIPQLLSRVSVDTLYLPDFDDQTGNRALVEKAAEEANTKVIYLSTGLTLTYPGGQMHIYPPQSTQSSNEASVSVLWSVGDFHILSTGDMNTSSEEQLLETYKIPDLSILVAGHHGSKSSTGFPLLKSTLPEIVIICVGDNSYGHPTEETLARIESVGAVCYRTDQHGTITIRR